MEKANNPEGPIQNNNESFVVIKILLNIFLNIKNDSDVSKMNGQILKKLLRNLK